MNKEQLLEDVKFPLKWDSNEYKKYIFDSDNEMIAQVERRLENHPFEKLIGDYKEVDNSLSKRKFYYYKGEFMKMDTNKPIGMVRGWGRLQYKDNSEERQDNIAVYILNILNS